MSNDNETYSRALRHVGKLEALDALAKACDYLPGDKMTASLVADIRRLTNKAVLSAWEYSGQYRPADAQEFPIEALD